jgi:hypothetical protein
VDWAERAEGRLPGIALVAFVALITLRAGSSQSAPVTLDAGSAGSAGRALRPRIALRATATTLAFSAFFAFALRSASWIVPFLMFAPVTTNAAVAPVAVMSTAAITAAMTAFNLFPFVGLPLAGPAGPRAQCRNRLVNFQSAVRREAVCPSPTARRS